ncbi:MAG: tyrosine--tRNA ligase [Bacteroidota bacterium]
MNFLEELTWRGMIKDMTPGVEEELAKGMVTGYIGFDPTASSMTIGNYVQLMLLSFFQRSGHQPIVLMGGATGRIGDPSGKDKERQLKSYEELDHNLRFQQKQAMKFLNFEDGPNKAIVVNNLDFYKEMNVLAFLRDVGKTLTVNYMTSKESVKTRLEGTGLSFTEFSYQLLQAYDYQCLYNQYNCKLQMGGSDQWGNIMSGKEFIRKNLSKNDAHAITTPLLKRADGKKFGKSEGKNIWLDPTRTSPYQFYQFWLKANDNDLPSFLRYFSFKGREEVEALEKEYADNPRPLKQILAEELTIRVHSQDDFERVQTVSMLLFDRSANRDHLLGLDEKTLEAVAREIPSHTVARELFANGVNIVDLLAEHTKIVKSKGEARRAISGNAIAVNMHKISSIETTINHEELLHGKYVMVENGKKNKFIITAE